MDLLSGRHSSAETNDARTGSCWQGSEDDPTHSGHHLDFYSEYPLIQNTSLFVTRFFPAEGRIFWSLKSPETSKNEVSGACGAGNFGGRANYSKYPLVNYNLETRGYLF